MINEDLAGLVKSLPLPEHYFKGQRADSRLVPENVLCWHPHELGVGRFQHYRFLLMMSFKGAVTVLVDGSALRLTPGHAILCFPFQQHAFVDADEDRAWLFVTFELPDPGGLATLRNRVLLPTAKSWEIAERLVRSYLDGGRPGRTCLLAALLLDEVEQRREGHGGGEHPEIGRGVLEKANRVIWEAIGEPLDIGAVARKCGVSASHLRFLFRSKFNRSIGRFIRETRINRARDLLATTELSVTQVAEACGFDTLFSFSRSFRNECGVAPSEYRRQAKAKELQLPRTP